MADITDVLDAIAGVLGAALYPNGTGRPSAIGANVSVCPGWPTANRLKAAVDTRERANVADQMVIVSVYPPPNLERATTRAMSQWLTATPPVHTVTAVVAGDTVMIGGVAAAGQNVGIIVDETVVVHAVQATDTPTTIATGLAALIAAGDRDASNAGPVLTIPGTHRLVARVGGPGRLVKEVERTDRSIMVSVWAPTPALRTAAARIVRNRLADPKFIALTDGSAGWIRYERTNDTDTYDRADLLKRDIHYWVEFGEYLVEDGFEVIVPQTATQLVRPDGVAVAPPTTTTA